MLLLLLTVWLLQRPTKLTVGFCAAVCLKCVLCAAATGMGLQQDRTSSPSSGPPSEIAVDPSWSQPAGELQVEARWQLFDNSPAAKQDGGPPHLPEDVAISLSDLDSPAATQPDRGVVATGNDMELSNLHPDQRRDGTM